jgi:hypothetical protein
LRVSNARERERKEGWSQHAQSVGNRGFREGGNPPRSGRGRQPIEVLAQSDWTAGLIHFAPPLTWSSSAMGQS